MREYLGRAIELLREDGPAELLQSFKNHLGVENRFLLTVQQLKYGLKYGPAAPSPYQLIEVRPESIKFKKYMKHQLSDQLRLSVSPVYGTFVLKGDWDQTPQVAIDEYYLWESTVEYFDADIPWERTSGFKKRNYDVSWFQAVEEVYEQIQSEGYKTQSQLDTLRKKLLMPPAYDEVRVNIGRDGNIMLDSGRHRFCAAKYLGLDKIPVRVFVRHKQWQAFRVHVYRNGLPADRQGLRSHPDLQDVLT